MNQYSHDLIEFLTNAQGGCIFDLAKEAQYKVGTGEEGFAARLASSVAVAAAAGMVPGFTAWDVFSSDFAAVAEQTEIVRKSRIDWNNAGETMDLGKDEAYRARLRALFFSADTDHNYAD